jgi:WhiB family redox-sensing transcriptional regulator
VQKNLIPTWRDEAACLGDLSNLFFPAGETGQHAVQAEQAKAVCARCPVLYTCLKAALDGNESGVWGGMTDRERHNLKNKTTRAQYATVADLRELLEVTLPPCANCGQHRKEKADGMCASCVTESKNAEKVAA